jgi:hypothetical protein
MVIESELHDQIMSNPLLAKLPSACNSLLASLDKPNDAPTPVPNPTIAPNIAPNDPTPSEAHAWTTIIKGKLVTQHQPKGKKKTPTPKPQMMLSAWSPTPAPTTAPSPPKTTMTPPHKPKQPSIPDHLKTTDYIVILNPTDKHYASWVQHEPFQIVQEVQTILHMLKVKTELKSGQWLGSDHSSQNFVYTLWGKHSFEDLSPLDTPT